MGGVAKPGGPTIADVAQLAGVSSQTVSRVSTGAQNVRPETRRRVLDAMSKLGYSPNNAARSLRIGSFGTLGLIAHRYERTGEVLTTGGVIAAAEREGYTVSFLSIETQDEEHWQQAAHRISNQAIDGLIIVRAEDATPDSLTLPVGLPIAVSDSRLVAHYPAVTADQLTGSIDATRHLLDLGHATVHHISGPADSEPAQLRMAAWRRCLAMSGIAPPEPLEGDWTPRSGYELGQQLARDPRLTAVYAANDETAVGLIRALHEAGLRVPQDVSVVGFDDIALAEYLSPPLTTVKQDFPKIGAELVRLVLEQIRSTGAPPMARQRTVVPTELIVRSTTAPPAPGR